MKRILSLTIILLFTIFGLNLHAEHYSEMKKCLMEIYGVNKTTSQTILTKIANYEMNDELYNAIHEFIIQSHYLSLEDNEEFSPLSAEDAVLVAPEWHEVLFENKRVRILWACSKPGDHEPFHIHQWKSLLLIIQGAEFLIENLDGTTERGFWPVGVYDLPPDDSAAAYTNLGPSDFISLRFEIK